VTVLNRRDVLKLAALAPAGAAVVQAVAHSEALAAPDASPVIKRYSTLGRTGERVSDLCLGAGQLSGGPPLVARALQMGLTYIDTAPDYGDSERTIGEGWRKAGVARDKFFITTKLCEPRPYPGHAPRRTPEKKLIEWVEGSLRRLKMDYVDNLFIHALGERGPTDIERLRDPDMLAAVETLKKQGKIRHLGCSSHGPFKPLECLKYAVESGKFDLIMPAYNLYKWPGLDEVLKLAQAKNVGVIAMKTLRGGEQAKEKGVLPAGNFAHNAFKWVWSNPAVNGLVVTIRNIPQLEGYAQASGGKLAALETESMTRMAALTSGTVCRIGCGDCLDRCSKGVQIPTVFRHDMYYREYPGEAARARAEYGQLSALGSGASVCATCTDQSCTNACSYGIPIRPAMLAAQKRLV
jgi:predicted aldo/keto reductase-like oxidoreductase